jgi:hypothetical protein
MKTIFSFFSMTLALLLNASLAHGQNDSVSSTLSGLPDHDSGSGMIPRINTISVTLDSDTIHAKPGQSIGWGFKVSWQSNAGDRLSMNTSTCLGDLSPVSTAAYTDIIGVIGGNTDGHIAAGASWASAFVPISQGLGYVTISPSATPGAQFFGEIRVNFSIHDNSAGLGKYLATRSITLPVVITVDEPDPVMAQDQTITFETIPAKTIGDPSFTIVASSSSGLPVEIYSTFPDICTVEGNTATIHSAGTCVIMVEQAGNAAFHEAPPVSQSFVISKQPAEITLTGSTDRNFTGSAQTFGTTTMPPSLPVSVLYNGEETEPVNPGIYIATAAIEDPTYAGGAESILTITNLNPPIQVTFEDWINEKFTTGEREDPAITSLTADPENDGQNNLFEYAFDFDPKNHNSASERGALLRLGEMTALTNSVAFEIPSEARADLTLIIQGSSDLAASSWREIARRQGNGGWTGSADVFTAPPSGGRAQVILTESRQPPHASSQFYRIKVVKNPAGN